MSDKDARVPFNSTESFDAIDLPGGRSEQSSVQAAQASLTVERSTDGIASVTPQSEKKNSTNTSPERETAEVALLLMNLSISNADRRNDQQVGDSAMELFRRDETISVNNKLSDDSQEGNENESNVDSASEEMSSEKEEDANNMREQQLSNTSSKIETSSEVHSDKVADADMREQQLSNTSSIIETSSEVHPDKVADADKSNWFEWIEDREEELEATKDEIQEEKEKNYSIRQADLLLSGKWDTNSFFFRTEDTENGWIKRRQFRVNEADDGFLPIETKTSDDTYDSSSKPKAKESKFVIDSSHVGVKTYQKNQVFKKDERQVLLEPYYPNQNTEVYRFRQAECKHLGPTGKRLIGPYRRRVTFNRYTYDYFLNEFVSECYPYFEVVPFNDETPPQKKPIRPSTFQRADDFNYGEKNDMVFLEDFAKVAKYRNQLMLPGPGPRPILKNCTQRHAVNLSEVVEQFEQLKKEEEGASCSTMQPSGILKKTIPSKKEELPWHIIVRDGKWPWKKKTVPKVKTNKQVRFDKVFQSTFERYNYADEESFIKVRWKENSETLQVFLLKAITARHAALVARQRWTMKHLSVEFVNTFGYTANEIAEIAARAHARYEWSKNRVQVPAVGVATIAGQPPGVEKDSDMSNEIATESSAGQNTSDAAGATTIAGQPPGVEKESDMSNKIATESSNGQNTSNAAGATTIAGQPSVVNPTPVETAIAGQDDASKEVDKSSNGQKKNKRRYPLPMHNSGLGSDNLKENSSAEELDSRSTRSMPFRKAKNAAAEKAKSGSTKKAAAAKEATDDAAKKAAAAKKAMKAAAAKKAKKAAAAKKAKKAAAAKKAAPAKKATATKKAAATKKTSAAAKKATPTEKATPVQKRRSLSIDPKPTASTPKETASNNKRRRTGKPKDDRKNDNDADEIESEVKLLRVVSTKREVALRESSVALTDHGLTELEHSPVSGNFLFYPAKVIKPEHYRFIRLVGCTKDKPEDRPLKSTDAKTFYCILCGKEYKFSPGCSNQITRHNDSKEHEKNKVNFGISD